MRVLTLLAVLLLAPLTDALAQEQPLEPGQRVRVTVPSLDVNKQKATFQGMAGDTLVLSSASYSLSGVTRFDVYSGRKSHFWAGAGIGFLVGAAGGAVAGSVVNCGGEDQMLCVGWGAGVFGLGGAIVGGLVGAFVWKADKWEEVPLDRLRVRVVPQRGGRLGFGI